MRQITDEKELASIMERIPKIFRATSRPWKAAITALHEFRCDFDYSHLQSVSAFSLFTEYMKGIDEERCYLAICGPDASKKTEYGYFPAFEFLSTDNSQELDTIAARELQSALRNDEQGNYFSYCISGGEFVITSEKNTWLAFASFDERLVAFSAEEKWRYETFFRIICDAQHAYRL